MQVVSVKPIARWQIWLGKWLGLLCLNAVLLALAGAAIFTLLQWRAARLPAAEQRILRDEIFVARASARERPPDLSHEVDKLMRQRVKNPAALSPSDLAEIRQQVTGQLNSALTEVPPGLSAPLGHRLAHLARPLARSTPATAGQIPHRQPKPGHPLPDRLDRRPNQFSPRKWASRKPCRPDSFQEFQVPANLLDDNGMLWVDVVNPNDTALTFPMEDGFELLYPESTFGINFVRGMAVIFCWLALLASIGLADASFLSFPVAAFASMALLLMGLSSGTIGSVVEQGTIMGYDAGQVRLWPLADRSGHCAGLPGRAQNHQVGGRVFPRGFSEHRPEHHLGPIGFGGGANRPPVGRLLLRSRHPLFHPARTGHGAGQQRDSCSYSANTARSPHSWRNRSSNRLSAAGNSYRQSSSAVIHATSWP